MEEIKSVEEREEKMVEVKENAESSENTNILEEEINMEDLLRPGEKNIEEGEILKVKVVSKTGDSILVDLGVKSEGIIPKEEFSKDEFEEINIDSEIPVAVVSLHSKEGGPVVSYRQAKEVFAWEKVRAAQKSSMPINGVVKKKIKGGFIVDIGADAFLPTSQLEIYKVNNPDSYIGQKMSFLVSDLDYPKRNIVLSRRKLLEIEQKESRKKTMEIIHEGQVLEGIVTRLTDFGAFVEIGGMEGLLHVGDISWRRIKKPSEVLSQRQNVQVKVLKIDREKEQVSLGMKQLTPHPWENIGQKYKEGDVIKCKITSKTDFGMFAELSPGLEGLLHISEISWTNDKPSVMNKFSAGQELELKITAIDSKQEKLSLSLKRMTKSPWEEAKGIYPPGTKIKGKVTNITSFGAFVKFTDELEGLIHVSDMSWVKKVQHPKDVLKAGQEVEAVVLSINVEDGKISLSLKHLTQSPFKKYSPGTVVTGKVKRTTPFGAFVELEPGLDALLHISEVAPKKPARIEDAVKIGEEVEAKVIKSDDKSRKIDISVKKLEREREKELLKKYVNKNSMPTLGDILEEE